MKMTKEEVCAAIVKLNDGRHTQNQMAAELGCNRGTINKYVKEMERAGDFKYNEPPREYHPSSKALLEREVKRAKIRDLVIKGYSINRISADLKIRHETVSMVVKEMTEHGEIQEVRSLYEYNKRGGARVVTPEKHKKGQIAKTTLAPGETVKCDAKIAKTCVYGSDTGANGFCRYMDVTHKSRMVICPCNACTVYSKRSKDNPKLIARGEEEDG